MVTSTAVLRRAVRGQRRDVVASSLLVAVHQLSEAAVPVVVGVVIDLAVSTGDATALLRWSAAVVAVFAVLCGSAFLGYWRLTRAEKQAAHALRLDIAGRVLHPAGGAPGRSGELVGLAGSDADRAGLVCAAIVVGCSALAALAGGAAVLISASVLLGLVVLAGYRSCWWRPGCWPGHWSGAPRPSRRRSPRPPAWPPTSSPGCG